MLPSSPDVLVTGAGPIGPATAVTPLLATVST